MKIHNTLTNRLEEIDLPGKEFRVYLCGVTVYDDCHLGHARTIVVFDVLRRFLESRNVKVIFVQNFTDIDDKIIAKAIQENVESELISERYIRSYFADFDALNVRRATFYPRVTKHISDIIAFIIELIRKEKAYVGTNGVYYRVRSFSRYGKLSKKSIELMNSGIRIEVDETKEDPRDFALWKFSPTKPHWTSPWGNGRPGWHIECSVMASIYLGMNFDIHGGGQDLIFPHHENELAQSEGLYAEQFTKLWMHVGMVTIGSEKMSKSLGNMVKISDLLKSLDPNIIRLFCISSHYSKPLDFATDIINELGNKWRQVENAYYELEFRIRNEFLSNMVPIPTMEILRSEVSEHLRQFEECLEDDLNFSLALTIFFKFINKINILFSEETILDHKMWVYLFNILEKFMYITGLIIHKVSPSEKDEIEKFIHSRNILRSEKNFIESDKIRTNLLDKYNVELIDHKGFTVWKKSMKTE